jgi:pimeloyl-ACP methyl ester carboxylesterase
MVPVGLFLLVLGLMGLTFWYGPASAPAPGGISRLEQVKLGGVPQWISIRAADPHAPVLLFLHGGPGSANLAKIRAQVPDLEQHFVVVNWDQSGAGKSAGLEFDYGVLSIERMISDAHELVTYLKTRFGVEKIYVMGFSWGTVIGLPLAARYPQDLYAYIAVSQIVQPAEGERLSLERVRQAARQAGNTSASAELAAIDPSYRRPDWFQQISTERKWLLQLGGVYHTATSYSHEIGMMLKAREYSLAEFALWPGRSSASLKALWGQVMGVNFFKSTPAVGCPVYFFVGRYDDNVPGQLTAAYYAQLAAPAGKHLIWFENSAHDLFFDEPGPVVRETLNVLDARK